MSPLRPFRRSSALLALTLVASLLSCGREITGPNGTKGRSGALNFIPRFATAVTTVNGVAHSIASLVPFERVRIVLTREGLVVVDQMVEFPSTADSVPLSITVPLSLGTGTAGESFAAVLNYINAAGDTVFTGGPVTVIARPGTTPGAPAEVPVVPAGPATRAVRVEMAQDSVGGLSGQTVTFTARAFDAQDNEVPNVPIGYISRNPALVAVPQLGVGSANLVGLRGSTFVLAQLITGQIDSTRVGVTAPPAQILRAAGNAQQTIQGVAFAEPLRIRVVASDGLGVANWPVQFAVTAGGGTLTATSATTDSLGFAETSWTAGSVIGAGTVVASVTQPALSVEFTGTQFSAGPSSLAFVAQPQDRTQRVAMAPVTVQVRNGLGQLIPTFTGSVAVALDGGPDGAVLAGPVLVNAVGGVASFDGLSVDRVGVGYRLSASLPDHAAVPAALSNPFAISAAPPASILRISGDEQSALQGVAFAEPVRVRLLAADGVPVPGFSVDFAVATGGGSVAPTAVLTDVGGFAEATWTAGAALGAASLTASVASPALSVTFTGTQLSAGPVAVAFTSQPPDIVAGAALGPITVEVRNAIGAAVTTFTGNVTLALTGGTAGTQLVDAPTTVAAVAGVATFTGLSIDRGGSAFRLVATAAELPPAQSDPFDAQPPPAAAIAIVGGNGQTGVEGTPLADSLAVRLTDRFDRPVVGAAVGFGVTEGAGNLSPTSVATDADGRAATLWTLGPAGPQGAQATHAALEPAQFTATALGAGEVRLFTGYDYTYVAVGNRKAIRSYLTSNSPVPVTVTLSTSDTVIAWDGPTATIPAATRYYEIPIRGVAPGSAWAILQSDVGSDSVFVTVDSASVRLAPAFYYDYVAGDTIRTVVLLSDPAPPGGVTVQVTSPDSAYLLFAPDDGSGNPSPSCLDEWSCSGLRAERPRGVRVRDPQILAPFAATAEVFVPAGQKSAAIAILLADLEDEETAAGTVHVSAAGYRGTTQLIEYSITYLQVYGVDWPLAYGDTTELGVGQVFGVEPVIYPPSHSRDVPIRFASSDTSVMTVNVDTSLIRFGSAYGNEVLVRGRGTGTAYLVWSYRGVPYDSALFGVVPTRLRATRLSPFGTSVQAGLEGYGEVQVHSDGPGNRSYRVASATPVTITNLTPTVLQLDRAETVIPRGATVAPFAFRTLASGTGQLVFSAPGHAPDTLFVSVVSSGVSLSAATMRTGVGLVANLLISMPANSYVADRTSPIELTVASSDNQVARVLTPSITVVPGATYAFVRVEGRQLGTVTLQFTGGGLDTVAAPFTVESPRFRLSFGTSTTIDADSLQRSVPAFLVSGGIGSTLTRAAADTIVGILRSTDPTVVEVLDSVIVFRPGESSNGVGRYRAVRPGAVYLTVESEDIPSDLFLVSVRDYQLNIVGSLPTVPVGLERQVALYRRGPTSAPLPFEVTGNGAAGVRPNPDLFEVGAIWKWVNVHGRNFGTDTLRFLADGYATAQLITSTTEALILPGVADIVQAGNVHTDVSARLASPDATWLYLPPSDSVVLLVSSSDQTIARVLQDSVVFEPGNPVPVRNATIEYLRPGTVQIEFLDPSERFGVVSREVGVITRDLYRNDFEEWLGARVITMGMQQRTEESEIYVGRGNVSPDPLWVRLQSSAPQVVSVPDSVLIGPNQYYADFHFTSGDSIGSAVITAFAPGYNEVQWDVLVSRTQLTGWSEDGLVGGRRPLEVYTVTPADWWVRSMVTDVPLRISVADTVIADVSELQDATLPAGVEYHVLDGPRALQPGRTMIRLEDGRSGAFQALIPGDAYFDVRHARIRSVSERSALNAGLGLSTANPRDYIDVELIRDTVIVGVRSALGRLAIIDSTLLFWDNPDFEFDELRAAYVEERPLRFYGLELGVDTLILEADGYEPLKLTVYVTPGAVDEFSPSSNFNGHTFRAADSLALRLSVRDPSDSPGLNVEPMLITFDINGDFEVRRNGVAVTEMMLEPGQSRDFTIWVFSIVTGEADLTIGGPDLLPYRVRISTREPAPGLRAP